MALLSPNGELDNSLLSRADINAWHVLRQPDGKRIISGPFEVLSDGESRFGIARYNGDGSLDNDFHPSFSYDYADVRTMTVQSNGNILTGGLFSSSY